MADAHQCDLFKCKRFFTEEPYVLELSGGAQDQDEAYDICPTCVPLITGLFTAPEIPSTEATPEVQPDQAQPSQAEPLDQVATELPDQQAA